MNNERPSMSMFATAADYNAAMDEWLTTTKMLEAGERMAFEAYMKQDKLGQRPTPDGAGGYAVTEVDWAWEAWKARAALAASPSSKSTKEADKLPEPPSFRTEWGGRVVAWGDALTYGHECFEAGRAALASSSIKEDGERAAQEFMVASIKHKAGIVSLVTLNAEDVLPPLESGQVVTLRSSPPSPLGDTPDQQEKKQ